MAWKNRLLALSVGTVFVFLAQSMVCFAERTGILLCSIHIEEHQSSADSEQQESSPQECCMHSDTAMGVNSLGISLASVPTGLALKLDSILPTGSIREIDHPPQLS